MHPDIILFWEKHGFKIVKIKSDSLDRFLLQRDGDYVNLIAYQSIDIIIYYSSIHGECQYSEREMLSYIKLQPFI